MSVLIRPVEQLGELRRVSDLQKIVWNAAEHIAIPAEYMNVVVKSGGCVLGAFEGEDLLAFTLSVPAFDARLRPYHHLHMLGTHPQARGRGLAYELLQEQYTRSAAMGISRLVWTFDPFEFTNARLYLHRASAVVASPYLPNEYGDWGNGLPTDRFTATRYLQQPARLPSQAFGALEDLKAHYTVVNEQGLQANGQALPTEARIAVMMPANFGEIVRNDIALACAWKAAIGAIFTHYLRAGYVVCDLVRVAGETFYLLHHDRHTFVPLSL